MQCSISMCETKTFLFFVLFSWAVSSQQIVVMDAENGNPVVNVAIYNKDKSKSAITDFDGRCDLSAFNRNERIEFRHISYQPLKTTKALILRKGNKVFLQLKPEQLDEVVMSVSKWEQQRKDIPQKVVSIDAQSIALASPQTSADLLWHSGKVFVQKSQLGGGSPMIRGFATNRVLLSVDGVRMNNAIFRGGNIQNVISIDP
ncbi:MAG: TonB-dependent receptor, partial [Muricauda sp.]|nr:TonB-dependent receptor [Allomuricauda sp.]